MSSSISPTAPSEIEVARARLYNALERNRSQSWCLRLWSKYIKIRDQHRCIGCNATQKLQAHHIVRKTLFPWGALELGNGITLCSTCHAKLHSECNTRPDLTQPFGAEGGDDQDEWTVLFEMLYDDAIARQLDPDRFYFIGDHMCKFFKTCQGYGELYDATMDGEISRLSYAFRVWRSMPEHFYQNYMSELVSLNLVSPGSEIKWPK